MAEKLEPCPFCGDTWHVRLSGDSEISWVACEACLAEGPSGVTRAEAARAWNRRPQKEPKP